jgi:hypothetical protein
MMPGSGASDPLHSRVLHRELPGVLAAFDAEAMRERLQVALFGAAHAPYSIQRCTPGKATYLAGDGCLLRYQLEVADHARGRTLTPLVNARLFRDRLAGETYLRQRLEPLAAAMRGREETAPFAAPVAWLEPLDLVVSAFPIDGDLPMLVGATDRRRMLAIFRETFAGEFAVDDCRVEIGHYGRQHRCVLRYHLTGRRPGRATPERRLVYGKVAADERGALAGPVLSALRERLRENHGAYQFDVPRLVGFRPDLGLVLLEALPGVPRIAALLAAWPNGASAPAPEPRTLIEALDTCAHIASTLHTSGITLGRLRTLDDDLALLRQGFGHVGRLSPALGARLLGWLEQVAACGAASEPLPPCLSHGDFTHSQVIFDGATGALVDFDTLCQAEPALDLGQFLAYLRVVAWKAHKTSALAELLCARFLATYLARTGGRLDDAERLRARVGVYEAVSLLRMALHSWQQLKGARLENVLAVLEERVACLVQM